MIDIKRDWKLLTSLELSRCFYFDPVQRWRFCQRVSETCGEIWDEQTGLRNKKKRVHAGLAPVDSQSLDFLRIMCAQFKWYFNLLLYYWEHLHIFTFIIFLWVTFQECVFTTTEKIRSIYICSITRLIGSSRLRWTKRIEWFYGPRWMRTTLGRWPRMSSRRGKPSEGWWIWSFRSVPRHGGSFWIMSSFPTKDGEAVVDYRWSSRLGIPHAGKAGHWLCCRQICKSVGSSTGTWLFFSFGVAFCGVLNLLGSWWFGLAEMLVFWRFHVENTCFSLTCLSKQQAFEFIRSNKLKSRSAFLVKFRVLSLREWLLPGFLLNRQFWSDEVSISSTQLQEFQIWVQAINYWGGEESTHFAELVD